MMLLTVIRWLISLIAALVGLIFLMAGFGMPLLLGTALTCFAFGALINPLFGRQIPFLDRRWKHLTSGLALIVLGAGFLFLSLSFPPKRNEVNDALDAELANAPAVDASENADEASISQLEALAAENDATAIYDLGVKYASGSGVARDYGKSFRYFKQACDLKMSLGCQNLGISYLMGDGTPPDIPKGISLLKPRCDAGDGKACRLVKMAEDAQRQASEAATAPEPVPGGTVVNEFPIIGKFYLATDRCPTYEDYANYSDGKNEIPFYELLLGTNGYIGLGELGPKIKAKSITKTGDRYNVASSYRNIKFNLSFTVISNKYLIFYTNNGIKKLQLCPEA